ncbi:MULTISPECIES: VOC family protein [unclassified Solwaraspora]|uniref:VOC family protein n=1 Tax=unclassified Solwaraspora TaxID=2627926 RepID=UPI00259BBD9E|nr:VOC family protein [Solwaraspora sp. WMMA2056]WJK43031.1 VOC family protein [Solwaraspora sp. WMMA2056]
MSVVSAVGGVSELRYVTLGVRDLPASIAFYRRAFGYQVLHRADDDGDDTAALWGLAGPCPAQVAVLGPAGATSGLLRLYGWAAPGPPARTGADRRDHGHYAVNLRVDRIDEVRQRVQADSELVLSAPRKWSITPEITVWDSLSHDPDGTVLDVFEIVEDRTGFTGAATGPHRVQTIAVHVPDADAATTFYTRLGLRVWFDRTIDGMADFFHVPGGVRLRDVNLYAPGSGDAGRVEIVQYVGLTGRCTDTAPPRTGITSISFEVDDLAAAGTTLCGAGGRPVADEVSVNLPVYGPARSRLFVGTGGEAIELFQRADDDGGAGIGLGVDGTATGQVGGRP